MDWKEILIGNEQWSFIWEIMLRTSIMFITIIAGLRILGKRGVKQLSIFELVVIIALGSAAGDPMISKDFGVVSSMVVFAIVIVIYSALTFIIGKSRKFEIFIEGKPLILVKEGKFVFENFRKELLGIEELLSELRVKGVSQLGQVELAVEEISGEISVFFYNNENVRYGLPILPEVRTPISIITEDDHYSCILCGNTTFKTAGTDNECNVCDKNKWVRASNRKLYAP